MAAGLLLAGILGSGATAYAGEIWVSPQGSDLNDGTRQAPKATLTSALRQAREWRRLGDERVQGGITICLEGGTYALHESVFIRPEDSGTEASPTII
ncbi:MAG TPA: right-handed parallel beta-helix repeat-containing protein, partial [Bacteroides reticulotermitis]|nr:right-handed parallel beta-helix repeat-containing protein [Bacteroides reticulotermitis]